MSFESLSAPRIREERERLGLTQAQLSDLTGVSRESWGKYERGIQVPGGEVLFSFAAAGADVLYILKGVRTPSSAELLPPLAHTLLCNFEKLDEDDQRAIQQLVKSLAMRGNAG